MKKTTEIEQSENEKSIGFENTGMKNLGLFGTHEQKYNRGMRMVGR